MPRGNWFVGLKVPTAVWFDALVADAPDDVRVFHPEDVHMTVAFLGACGEDAAMRAWALADGLEAAPFDAVLDVLIPLGNPRRPSALSATLSQGKEQAVAIMRALRDPMIEAAGARPETREPLPHATVARPARRASAEERRRAVAWATAKPAIGIALTIDTLSLYTWSEDRRVRQFRAVTSRTL